MPSSNGVMTLSNLLFFAVSVAHFADAFQVFTPNCTAPTAQVNYVHSPGVRGTMSIVWDCLAALLLCTWDIQHLAVPFHIKSDNISPWEQRILSGLSAKSFSQYKDLRGMLFAGLNKIKWMALTVFLPEYVLGKALAENRAAHYSRKQFEKIGHENWSTTHGYFANMRGFVLRFDIAAVPTSLTPSKPDELGRSLQKLRSGHSHDESHYYEQSFEGSKDIELDQCREICGIPCKNRIWAVSQTSHQSPPRVLSAEPTPAANPDWTDLEVGRAVTAKEPRPTHGLSIHVHPTGNREAEAHSLLFSNPDPETHITLANKQSPEHPAQDTDSNTKSNGEKPHDGTAEVSNQIQVQSSISTKPTEKPMLRCHKIWKGTWALSSSQIYYAKQSGIISQLPEITEEDLKDRSKGDTLLKILTVIQITWLVIQIITRSFQHLATTLLEVTVLAFASCAIATYIAFLDKPQDVNEPVYIDLPNVLTREQVIKLASWSPISSLFVNQIWLHGVAVRTISDSVFPSSPGIQFPFTNGRVPLNPGLLGIGIGGSLFGAVHFAAWNFAFPTPAEQLLWRISTCILFTLPILGTLTYGIGQHLGRKKGSGDIKVNKVIKPMEYAFIPFYLAARLFLMVEVVRELFFLPPSVFQEVDWVSVLPHAG